MNRILTGVLAGATALTLAAGCGVERFGPKLEMVLAAQDLAAATRAGFTLKAGGRVEDLIAAAQKDARADGRTLSATEAGDLRKIYNSSLTVAWDRAGRGDDDDRYLVRAVADGIVAGEMRVVDEVTYARVAFPALVAKFGGSAADLKAIRKQLGRSNAGVDTLTGGGWVWVSPADVEELTQRAIAAAPAADPEREQQISTEIVTSMENLISSADVTYDPKDRTHLIVTTSTARAYREGVRLVEAMQKLAGEPVESLLDGDLDAAPADRPIVLDLWIDEGRFRAFEIDFLQFVEGSTGRAGLRVEFTRGTRITAPGDADRLDLPGVFATVTDDGGLARTGGAAQRVTAWAGMIRS
jgi:hypothetical protein